MTQIVISKNSFTSTTMIDVAKMSAKGQIVIPEDIRKKLSLKQGSKLVLRQIGKQLIIVAEEEFEKQLLFEEKEQKGWEKLIQKSIEKDWNNDTDEEWSRYL